MTLSRFCGLKGLALTAFVITTAPQSPALAQSEVDTERMLALNIYHEARQDGRDGMIAVGWVVFNRVADLSFPDSVYGVITQGGETPPCQFGWWCDGKSDRPEEQELWQEAQAVARELLSDNRPADPTGGAIYFWETWRDTPNWAGDKVRLTATIGGNNFYNLK